jgi:ATP-dependent protease HslVU (ClpYQ) peptidase subunit
VTCIAALKMNGKVYMAGERGASNDEAILNLSKPKVYAIGPYVVGFAGGMEGQRVAYNFNPPRPHEDDNLDEFMNTTFLKYLKDFYEDWWVDTSKDGELELIIGIRDKLYEHHASDMSLNEYSSGYLSIGSGAPYAMGYLSASIMSKSAPEKVVEGAVKTAIKFSPTCSGTVDIVTS